MFRPPKIIDPKTPTVKMSEENQNIQVFVRSRPLKAAEKKSGLELIPEKKTIKFIPQNKFYTFDNVFDSKAKQIDIYRSVVEPLVDQVIEGYNCTVFAYGQTGTGKTYTMVGDRSDKEVSWEDDPTSGIIPRAIDQLIDLLQCQETEYTIRVSFLELYNEDAYDLLSPITDGNKLRIYNDSERKGSVIISGLVELIVKTKAEIYEILEKGSFKRQTAPTLMNACSSRSHSIFSVTVHIKETTLEGEEVVKMGKLNLVDLAGSENIGRSGAVEERAREASNINKSLLTLGRVITSLVEKSSHIPYRDSKLTRLLQDSLGGKTKTSIIATVSPGVEDLEDTISTLDYAQRAKKITNKPEINLKMSKKTLISEYLIEIDKLHRDLEAARDKKGIFVDAKNYASMEATLKEQEQTLELKEARIEHLQIDVNKWMNLLTEANTNLSTKTEELDDLKNELKFLNDDLDFTREVLKKTKLEVEEQKVLVDCHKTTEQKLHLQAKSIMDVTEESVSHVKVLHEKIDTLSSLENKNIIFRNQYLENHPKEMEKICEISSHIFDSINDGLQSIEESVLTSKNSLVKRGFDLELSFKQIETTVESFSKQFLDILQRDLTISKDSDNLKQVLTNYKAELLSILETSYKAFVDKKQKTITDFELFVTESLKKRSELEEAVMNQISNVNEASKYVTASVKSIKEDLLQNLTYKCTENQKLKDQINKLVEINNKNEVMLQKLFEISTEMNKNSLLMKKSFASCDSKIYDSLNNETNFTNGLSIKSDELIAFVHKEKTQMETFLSKVDQHGEQNCQNLLSKCTELKNIQTQIDSDYQECNKAVLSLTENNVTSVNDQIDSKLTNALVKSFETKTECVNELKSSMCNMTNSYNASMESFVHLASQNGEITLEKYKDMQSICDAYKSSLEHQINNCRQSSQDYFENGFNTYQSTGATPKKTTYSYPKELACTSPHERIIARFKENLLKDNNMVNNVPPFDNKSNDSECENDADENEQIKTEDTTFVVNKLANPDKVGKRKQLKERN